MSDTDSIMSSATARSVSAKWSGTSTLSRTMPRFFRLPCRLSVDVFAMHQRYTAKHRLSTQRTYFVCPLWKPSLPRCIVCQNERGTDDGPTHYRYTDQPQRELGSRLPAQRQVCQSEVWEIAISTPSTPNTAQRISASAKVWRDTLFFLLVHGPSAAIRYATADADSAPTMLPSTSCRHHTD